MLEVIEDLTFANIPEKYEWFEQARVWRLPYWDWGLPRPDIGMPLIFTVPDINIRVPKAKDGTTLPAEQKTNPLYRYQLKDKAGNPVLMGCLPPQYKIDDTSGEDDKGKIFTHPVRASRSDLNAVTDTQQ